MNKKDAAREKGMHDGHRKRMRQKFIENGFEGWSKIEILEYMLYYTNKRSNTNTIAHRLLDYSTNSFVTLLENTENMRMSDDIYGVGDETVLFLRALKEFIGIYKNEELTHKPVKLTRENISQIINTLPFSNYKEDLMMICLSGSMVIKNVINVTDISGENFAELSPDYMLKSAIYNKAKIVILVHNHIDGNRSPSLNDITETLRMDRIFRNDGIQLLDHFILCDGEVISIKMAAMDYLSENGEEIII